MKKTAALLGYILLLGLAACTSDAGGGVPGDEASPDAGVKADENRGPLEICGNGFDDNGNGFIDDQCPCTLGQTQQCWPGARDQRGVGSCHDGVMRCSAEDSEFPKWGPCTGAVVPTPETSDTDGVDQNCDGTAEHLQCVPKAEVCTGGQDEDCDGKIDCQDPDCTQNAACRPPTPTCTPTAEVCTGGKDEDCDGKIDCADPDCANHTSCAPKCVPTTESCTDGKDNDCDGKIDCADSDCAQNQACKPACTPSASWEFCTDGKDNDCDGKTDCDDDECWDSGFCSCTETCTPGAMRWCDENQFCKWGQQTCGPDRRWGACSEVTSRPQGCGNEFFYSDECCAAAGQCCQAMPVLPEPYSVGTCQPVTVTCQRS